MNFVELGKEVKNMKEKNSERTHPYLKQYHQEIARIKKAYPAVVEVPQWLKAGKIRDAWIYGGPLLRKMLELEGHIPGLWYEPELRLEERIYDFTPEIVDMLEEARINVVTVGYFTKNLGFRIERPQYEQTSKFIQECHKRGIKVLVYMSFSNIFRSFLEEYPEAITWVQRNADGTPKQYGPKQERFHGCTNNPAWFEHQKKVAITVVQSGADGVNIDNTGINLGGCYCGFCREAFRKFSQRRFGEEKGMPVEENWTDPLWQAFIEFRNLSWYRGLKRFYAYLHSLKNDIVIKLETCDSLPQSAHGYEKAQDLVLACDCQDMIESEVGAYFPRNEDGRMYNFINNYKVLIAGARGKPVEVLGYTPEHRNPTPIQLKLAIAEGLAHGGIHVENWRIMFMDYLSHPELREAIKEYNTFHEANEDYYVDAESRVQVAVVYSQRTNGWYKHRSDGRLDMPQESDDFSRPWPFAGFAYALQESQIPYDVLLEEDLSEATLPHYECLVLPNIACMDDDLIETVKTFVRQGGNILATYETSLYDGYGQRRENYGLRKLFGTEQKQSSEDIAVQIYGKGKAIFFSDKPDFDFFARRDETTRKLLVGAIDKLVERYLLLSNAPRTVIVSLTEKRNLLVLHLLNLEADAGAASVEDIAVQIALPQEKRVQRVVALSPDWEGEVELKFEVASDILRFTVPQLKIYTVVAVEFEEYRRPQAPGEGTQPSKETARPQEVGKQEKTVGDLLTEAV